MNANDTLHALRRALFAAAAMATAGLALWGSAHLARTHAAAIEADLRALHQAAHRQLDDARQATAERQRLHAALAMRYPPADRGHAPAWLTAVADLRARHSPFAFDLLPRTSPPPATELQVVPHTLRLAVLHEGRLNALLAELPQAGTRAILRGCRVRRNADATGAPPVARAHLHAECDIDWLTLPADALPPP